MALLLEDEVNAVLEIVNVVVAAGGGGGGIAMVFVPIMMAEAEGAKEMGVPERVIADPGFRVWEPITKLLVWNMSVLVPISIEEGGGGGSLYGGFLMGSSDVEVVVGSR